MVRSWLLEMISGKRGRRLEIHVDALADRVDAVEDPVVSVDHRRRLVPVRLGGHVGICADVRAVGPAVEQGLAVGVVVREHVRRAVRDRARGREEARRTRRRRRTRHLHDLRRIRGTIGAEPVGEVPRGARLHNPNHVRLRGVEHVERLDGNRRAAVAVEDPLVAHDERAAQGAAALDDAAVSGVTAPARVGIG